ncbi:MAG: hypothetical protein GY698_03615 [Actinomycetia bacterium]|nr:hypothetical protein [Actinomycetes bacterium]
MQRLILLILVAIAIPLAIIVIWDPLAPDPLEGFCAHIEQLGEGELFGDFSDATTRDEADAALDRDLAEVQGLRDVAPDHLDVQIEAWVGAFEDFATLVRESDYQPAEADIAAIDERIINAERELADIANNDCHD